MYALAIILFATAFIIGFSGVFATAITTCLVLGSILLAPAIVLGYAIRAAEREEADLIRRQKTSGRDDS